VTTRRAAPRIRIVVNSHLVATVRLEYSMRIPAGIDGKKRRTKTRVAVPLTVDLTLKQASRRVEILVRVDNRAKDHRLRMLFPLGVPAEHSFGEGQFDVVERPVARPDTRSWVEQPMYDYPMHHFVDVSDGKIGGAVLVQGLKEYEVFDDAQRTLAITLFRAFTYVIQPSSHQDYSHQLGSQCLGVQEYKLAFLPHRGSWHDARVYAEAMKFCYDVRAFQVGRSTGSVPPDISFLAVKPDNLQFSCLKEPEETKDGSFVLRLYNPTSERLEGSVSLFRPLKSATLLTLEEKPVCSVALAGSNAFLVTAEPKQIMTVLLEFAVPS
jgi:alpha-mannosidase